MQAVNRPVVLVTREQSYVNSAGDSEASLHACEGAEGESGSSCESIRCHDRHWVRTRVAAACEHAKLPPARRA